ncbi:MAG: gliding motility-associated C-terminal domain-containing protein [Bacteroidales bacterium]|nr:gliding motility-associated C-terminal domain-containing protein [Bacteroidales bacterium]
MGSAPLVSNIDDAVRNFYDPGGVPGQMGDNQDPNGYFAQNLRDTMTLRTNMSGTVLYVLFEEFAMGNGDTLWIFDGPNVNSPLYGVYSLVQNPGEIFASDRMMTFVFHSDDADIPGLQAGWSARVYAYSTSPEVFEWYEYYNPTSVLTCNSWFYDSGGPNGNIASVQTNAENNHVNFISPAGTHIKCEFTQFAVNGVMQVYDGQFNDPNKRLIGQFCTSTLDAFTNNRPPVLFSTGNALSFVYFGAAGDMQKAGWAAEISCVAELFDSPDGSACPSVTNDVDPLYSQIYNPETKTILWDCDIPIILLKTDVIATGRYTNDYSVKSIPFSSHIFEFNQGNSINASSDDNWLSGVSLPFTFTFFGRPYNMVWPGTNGLIAMENHSGSCAYAYGYPPNKPPYSASIDGNQTMGGGSMTCPYNYNNCIYGVYEDIDCNYYNSYSYNQPGAVRVGVLGSPPCRAFVFNYLNVGLFGNYSSASNYNTYQMVIYEGTNIIDVYVKHRACCASTNNSRHEGIIGIQNKTSSQILLAPGRGMNGWTADEEAWRFTPVTPLDELGELRWFVNDTNSAVYSRDKVITVSKPNDPVTKYIAVYTFTNASNQHFTLMDTTTILVQVPDVEVTSSTGNNFICPGDPATLSASFSGFSDILPVSYRWSNGDTTATAVVNPLESTTYTLTVTFNNGCDNWDTVRVKVTELELPEITGTEAVCQGYPATLVATHPTSTQFHWSNGQNGPTITVTPQVTTQYSVSATMEGNCTVIDTFTVHVLPLPAPSFVANPTEIYVENNIGTVTCTSLSPAGYHLIWNFGDVFSNVNVVENVDEVTHDYTHSGYYTITLTAIDSAGCVDSTKTRVSVEVPYFFYIPNAFTPDGDGVNETFAPRGEGVDPDQYSMQIFDRSGMLIYSTRNPYDYWDGRNKYGQMCPEGVYIFIIRLVNLNGDDKEYTGSVTLVK